MYEFGTALCDEVRAVLLLQTLHVGNARRSTEPCQLVSTSPDRETAYFLISLKSFAMPPSGASSS